MVKKIILLLTIVLLIYDVSGQIIIPKQNVEKIPITPGEKWWGGAVNDGIKMPFEAGYSYDMYGNLKGNQAQPLLLSNQGRIIWSEAPFKFTISDNEIILESKGEIQDCRRQTEPKKCLRICI
jgi:hypothetical protein